MERFWGLNNVQNTADFLTDDLVRILAALIFTMLLWILFLIRLQRMNKETEARLRERLIERERIARELHDTLLQGFQCLYYDFR